MKIDFHVHTMASPDSLNSLRAISKICRKKGITPVISDHNRISNALKYRKRFGDCIVAEEIMTDSGEVICLFASEWIPPHLPVDEVVDRIREQGALVYVPHPFDRLRCSTIRNIFFKPDIMEVFNSRVTDQKFNLKAKAFAERNGFLKAVGSDAHFPFEIGRSYVEMEPFDSIKEFRKNLEKASAVTRPSPVLLTYPLTKMTFRSRNVLFGHHY